MRSGPTYLELADRLEADCLEADAGDRVASEHELAGQWGVSRLTARAALQELERRFLVRRVRGAGTFVTTRIPYRIGRDLPPSFTATVEAAGHTATWRIVNWLTRPAGVTLAQSLSVSEHTKVVQIRRLGWIDTTLASFSVVSYPVDVVPGLTGRLGEEGTPLRSLYRLLAEEYDLRPRRLSTRASLELPGRDVARWLAMERRAPAWLVESVSGCSERRRPIEATRTWMRADVVQLVFELADADDAFPTALPISTEDSHR